MKLTLKTVYGVTLAYARAIMPRLFDAHMTEVAK
jgi:hypothetical protein